MDGEGTLRPFRGNYTRTLLPAVLKGKQTVIGDARSLRMAEDGEDAALVGGFNFLSHAWSMEDSGKMESSRHLSRLE